MKKSAINKKKEYYLKMKKTYDEWRKKNTHKQAWHQFNHNRRLKNKSEISFEYYLTLIEDSSYLDSIGRLKPSLTKDIP